MIVVKIELWPAGFEDKAREIGRMYVANDVTTTVKNHAYGSYDAVVCRRGTTENPLRGKVKAVRTARVENFPRKSTNVWRLVARLLKGAFPEEK